MILTHWRLRLTVSYHAMGVDFLFYICIAPHRMVLPLIPTTKKRIIIYLLYFLNKCIRLIYLTPFVNVYMTIFVR